MAETSRRARRTSLTMPPQRAVLALDAEGFSRTPSRHQGILNTTVRDVLAEAFDRAGLADLWRDCSFPQHTGDGYVVGVPSEYLPLLVHPLMDELHGVLTDTQPHLAFEDRGLWLRLRAAIGLGPLPDSGGVRPGDGVGSAMTETHRLLDAAPLKAALADSDPEITLLVVGLTARAHEDAVLGGYTALSPRAFRDIEVSHPAKGYRATGHLYVPRPSARPRAAATGNAAHEGDATGAARPAARRPDPGTVVFEAVRDV
ncbi:hypothetical protein [Nocardiopsis lambiniae]|uniref:Guanylate cyclase domain-containing protein n=1 Tax=Nocardiopsis lambiniae TaxID=3075539 RepID=A0ABU2MDA1_9ACTN|nr:hypothetical protein [Nocardiopsis sp. DSM 44743]MDT0330552.1 hypothetical protein [Nocardiopsis sp. DSM 44743]